MLKLSGSEVECGENLLSRATFTGTSCKQPGGQAEAIVVDFGKVETGFVLEAGGSIASQSQQISLWVCRVVECQH